MHHKERLPHVFFGASLRPDNAALAIMILLLFLIFVFLFLTLTVQPAEAQTYKVIYNFTGGPDGAYPIAGLTWDQAGNLYGTALEGGVCNGGLGCGYGAVYQLKHNGSGWILNPLHSFVGGGDGVFPEDRVIFGPDGLLYGTTSGGGAGGRGTVFKMRPSPGACPAALCPWVETVLYAFASPPDGGFPSYGDLVFDQPGNIYGTTYSGGLSGYGTVFELTPPGSWNTEIILHEFSGSDGAFPTDGVIFDNAGNLYGTTNGGYGAVFELTKSGSSWTETVLYSFRNGSDGSSPYAGLIFDQLGNLYGTTSGGGAGFGGAVFKLTPSHGSWTYSLLYSFTGHGLCGPEGTLVMDGAGNLYGTTYCDGANGLGNVFKLTPSGNSWMYTSLHDFTSVPDGREPLSNVVFDASGNLYGTALNGGSGCAPYGCGIVWEITP